MELEGRLTAFPLPEVLQFLAQGKLTGILSVTQETIEVHLEIREGKIISSSSVDRPNRLGEMLVRRGVIPRSDVEDALRSQREENRGRMIGEILIERGLTTEEQLHNTIRLQMEEEIWELFEWREGEFKFQHCPTSEKRPMAAEIEIEPLLLEGSQRSDEWQHIVRVVPDDSVVFGVAWPGRDNAKELRLPAREWEVLRLLNGRYTVGSIIARTGFGTFETYRSLSNLASAGLVLRCAAKEAAEGQRSAAADSPPAAAPSPASNGGREARAESSRAAAGKRWRIGGLLSRKREEEEKKGPSAATPAPQEAVTAATPVGLAAALINELVAALTANAEFAAGEADRTLLEDLWTPIVNVCPKADLVRVEGGRLQAGEFEGFATMLGQESALRSCYEDAMEALHRALIRLHKVALQRLGERTAERVFNTTRGAFAAVPLPKLFGDFRLDEFIGKVTA
ncbi:MAG: DUF4388 domain-containing protein [Candidatus Sumerlaeota bacterium]|nr:DUF4388 domain-containing protein [Candidatus Sumerlaeota bacterium]